MDLLQLEDHLQLQILEDSIEKMYDLPLIKKMSSLKFERQQCLTRISNLQHKIFLAWRVHPESGHVARYSQEIDNNQKSVEWYTKEIEILNKDVMPLYKAIETLEKHVKNLEEKKFEDEKKYKAAGRKERQNKRAKESNTMTQMTVISNPYVIH